MRALYQFDDITETIELLKNCFKQSTKDISRAFKG
jgi:hypothetical protein